MASKTKTKLCWNCEGNVSLIDETCPYCGVSVSPLSSDKCEPLVHPHPPPYQFTGSSGGQIIPLAPYASQEEAVQEQPNQEMKPDAPLPKLSATPVGELQRTAFTLGVLFLGSVMLLFGLILLLFSDEQGIFTLRWQGGYWFLYLLIGIPLLYIGWKASNKLAERDSL